MPDTPGLAPYKIILAQANTTGEGVGTTEAMPSAHGVEIGTPSGEAHGSHFPPFDATTFPSQLIWLIVAFGLLYWLMSKIALPRIGTILEERHDRIADDLEEAAKLKAESEAAAVAYEAALAQARNKSHAIATETREALAAQAEASRKSVEADLAAKLDAAEAQIAATKTSAMSNVKGIAVDATTAIVSQLTGIQPTPADVDAAVDAAIKG